MTEPLKGSCLCGACTLTATPKSMKMGACHCSMCRKWSGGVLLAFDCSGSVEIAEGSPVGSYRASEWGERLFCSKCGSVLLWQTQDGTHQSASIQLFEDPGAFEFDSQIFIDRKPANYAFANETKTMTEAEVMAMFAPPPEEHG